MADSSRLLCGRFYFEIRQARERECTSHTCRQPYEHLGAHLCWQCDFTWADTEPHTERTL
jgi:hypothetical protein